MTSGDHQNYSIIENGQNTEREESWRLEETWYHSNFSERPSVNADVKSSQVIILIIIIKAETTKINQILPYTSTNNITELNYLIYAGAKLVSGKIGVPLKKHKETVKTRMGRSTGNPDEKHLRKQAQMVKQKDSGICGKRMEKTTREKITVQLEEINLKFLAKEGRLNIYRQRVKQYRQNRTFQNNERKFYQQLEGHDTKPYLQPDAKETEQF